MLPFMPLDTPPSRPRQQSPALQNLRLLAAALLRIPQGMSRVVKRQFRLRTLLIFVFCVAIGGAWISYQRSLLDQQAAIAAELEQRGCIVNTLGFGACDLPIDDTLSWRGLLGVPSATRITSIMFPRACDSRDAELVRQVLDIEEIYFKNEADAQLLKPNYWIQGWTLEVPVCIEPPTECRYVLRRWFH